MASSNMDRAIQDTFPVVIAPHDGLLPASNKMGVRHILASDGIYRELALDWMIRRKKHSDCILPYGELQESLDFCIDSPPAELWREFVLTANRALPNEVAAWMVWNTESKNWRLVERKTVAADANHIAYENEPIADNELAIVDIHSHGYNEAYFSHTDDKDDEGGIKIAAVIGKVHLPIPELAMRLQAVDERLPLTLTGGGKFTRRLP